jgi:hypothetical protein
VAAGAQHVARHGTTRQHGVDRREHVERQEGVLLRPEICHHERAGLFRVAHHPDRIRRLEPGRPALLPRARPLQVGGLNLTRVDSDAQTVVRTKRLIARSVDDTMLVSFAVQGGGRVVQDGREALLEPGDLALYDTTRPYQLLFDGPLRNGC